MADPTEAEIRAQMGYAVLALEETRELAEVDGTNILGIYDQLVASLEGDYSADVLVGFAAFRAAFSQALSSSIAQSVLGPHLLNYGKLIASPGTDPYTIFLDLYDYYVTNSYTIEKRTFSFGSAVAGGSNVGDGLIHRLNVDANGYDIDSQTADIKTFKCVRDEHSGAQEHAEVFRITQEDRTQDFLSLKGGTGQPRSRRTGEIVALSCRNPLILRNPSFTQSDRSDSDYAAGLATPGSTTGITGWTLDATTNVQLDRNTYYRDSEGETDPQSLRFNGNATCEQNLNQRRANIPTSGVGGLGQDLVPIYFQVAVYRGSSADGTITLTLGSKKVTLDISTQGDGTWAVLKLAIGVNNWYPNWIQENPLVKIALASNTTGYVLFDEVIVMPFTLFDGGWYVIVGGQTPFLKDDAFTVTDTATETGVLQRWLVRSFGRYLPGAAPGAASWADPPPTPTPTATPTPTPTPT